jgi:tetratricopeptide (TPR) repeat protein
MARGAAKQRTAPRPAQPSRKQARRPMNEYEAQMFFPRLRRQAKWVFVFLAVVFAGGFVFFGVGSGSSLGDLLNPGDIFGTSSNSGSNVGKLKKRAEKNPTNGTIVLDYSRALDAKGETAAATAVLAKYVKLKPKDTEALQSLASHYETQATNQSQIAQDAANAAAEVSGSGLVPQLTDPKGSSIVTDPVVSAVTTKQQAAQAAAQTAATTAFRNEAETLKKLVAVVPDDTTSIYRVAGAAANAGDYKTAVTYLQKFLKLAPDAPEAAVAKQQLKQLKILQSSGGLSPTVVPSSGG